MSIELLQFCSLSIRKIRCNISTNQYAMMISKVNHGDLVNWATIMYSQLVKELIRWEKCQTI